MGQYQNTALTLLLSLSSFGNHGNRGIPLVVLGEETTLVPTAFPTIGDTGTDDVSTGPLPKLLSEEDGCLDPHAKFMSELAKCVCFEGYVPSASDLGGSSSGGSSGGSSDGGSVDGDENVLGNVTDSCVEYSITSTVSIETNDDEASDAALVSYGNSVGVSDGTCDQDYGGGVIIYPSHTLTMFGNAWKALQLSKPYTVHKNTVLSFSFKIMEEAEGHAICVDEDLSEDTFSGNRIRCIALGGSQYMKWSHVVNYIDPKWVEEQDGGILDFHIPVGTLFQNLDTVNFIAIIQDNDEHPLAGQSSFSSIRMADDGDLEESSSLPVFWKPVDSNTHSGVEMKQVSERARKYEVTLGELSASCEVDTALVSNKLTVKRGSVKTEVASFNPKQWSCERLAISGDGDTVVAQLRPANVKRNVKAKYYYWFNTVLTDDFPSPYTAYKTENVDTIYYPWSTGNFAGSGRTSYLGATFESYLKFPYPSTGVRLCLSSDDGSKLFLDGKLKIDNNGVHSFKKICTNILDVIGTQQLKVEFFERAGAEALMLEWGLGLDSDDTVTAIPADAWLNNVAIGGVASQSSTSYSGSASRAIDGNTNGDYGGKSVTHTSTQSNPWWKVNLNGRYSVSSVRIWNRTCGGGCGTRLVNPKITLLDVNGNAIISKSFSGYVAAGGVVELYFDNAICSQVKVSLAGSNKILSLAEVQVLGNKESSNLRVKYYVSSSSWTGLPETGLASLRPYKAEFVGTIDYPTVHNIPFAGSGLKTNVAALYEGYLDFPSAEAYKLCLTSDDGSKLYMDDVLKIDNDGTHPAREVCAEINASAIHKISVEYFQKAGSATLLLKWGLANSTDLTVIPASSWVKDPVKYLYQVFKKDLSTGAYEKEYEKGTGLINAGDVATDGETIAISLNNSVHIMKTGNSSSTALIGASEYDYQVCMDLHIPSAYYEETGSPVQFQFWNGHTPVSDVLTHYGIHRDAGSLTWCREFNNIGEATAVTVRNTGPDALLIDRITMSRLDPTNTSLVEWGLDDSVGWCLSSDRGDGNGSFRLYTDACHSCRKFIYGSSQPESCMNMLSQHDFDHVIHPPAEISTKMFGKNVAFSADGKNIAIAAPDVSRYGSSFVGAGVVYGYQSAHAIWQQLYDIAYGTTSNMQLGINGIAVDNMKRPPHIIGWLDLIGNEDSQYSFDAMDFACFDPNSSINIADSLTCVCNDGYISRNTAGQTLENQFDVCVSSLESLSVQVTSKSITFISKTVQDLYDKHLSRKAPDNDIVIDLKKSGKFTTLNYTDVDTGNPINKYTFSDLQPGYRYNVSFSYMSNARDETNLIFPAVTTCSCHKNEHHQLLDRTGKPSKVRVYQDHGHVMFQFQDNSYCEEAFSFTRSDYVEEFLADVTKYGTSFTRDYFFTAGKDCGSTIKPGTQASDDLSETKLTVGKVYSYCVRAVNPIHYMDHPFDVRDEGRTLSSSADSCASHRVQWESSIHGKITTEPNAGSLPIKDVLVTWSLLNEDLTQIKCDGCTGSMLTKKGGTFDIVFNIQDEAMYDKNDVDFPVQIRFSKTTPPAVVNNATSSSIAQDIEHKFLCNEGEDDCSGDIGTMVYLNHLQFKEPLHVYDDTSVPYAGKVFIDNTPLKESYGCPLANVKVCLVQERNVGTLKTNDTLVCGDTNSKGEYELPVIIGSRIDYVELSYHDHEFKPTPKSWFQNGVVIEAGAYYRKNDFRDVQKARLFVDVVGGLCNRHLGTSYIQIKIVGCNGWNGEEHTQPKANGVYNSVPAHLLDIEVMDIEDRYGDRLNHIQKFFQGLVRTIDLRSTSTSDTVLNDELGSADSNSTKGLPGQDDMKTNTVDNLKSLEKEEEEDLELVRFQYDGTLQISSVRMSGDSLQCSDYDLSLYDNATSLHVLEYMSYFRVRLDLKYEIIKDEVYCDIVDDDLKLRVNNYVGKDDNGGYTEFLASISDDRTRDALEKCSGTGCLRDITHDTDETGRKIGFAGMEDFFATGRPSTTPDYHKVMEFTVEGINAKVYHKAAIIVEGLYSKGPGLSFALPTHKPIMVLRDPPGSLSYAKYENVMTTIYAETSSTSTQMSNKFGVGVKMELKPSMDFCAGGGIGAVVLNCNEMMKGNNEKNTVDFEQGLGGTVRMGDDMKSNRYSTKWSYYTSRDPWLAGRMSDVFVVPNLNVMYEEVEVVDWNNSTCSVRTVYDGTKNSLPVNTTFDIQASTSKPALSFYSRYHIEYVKLPELRRNLDNVGDDEIQKMILHEGIDGWNEALSIEDENFKSATKNPSNSINNWFEDIGKKNMNEVNGDLTGLGGNDLLNDLFGYEPPQSAGLAPPSLLDESVRLDNSLVDEVDDPIQRIAYSGGGNSFSMRMTKDKMLNDVKLSCWEGCNSESDTNIIGPGLTTAGMKFFGVGLKMKLLPLQLNIHVTHESTKTSSDTDSTSIGFILGDEDAGDEFVLDLFYDALYGSIIFQTVGGRSKCPHEVGTAAIEDPKLTISRPAGPVFPEEDMVFEIQMENKGVGDSSQFVLYAKQRDNGGNLAIRTDGGLLGVKEYDYMKKDTSYKKLLVVQRGTHAYEFPAIDLVFESACEYKGSLKNDLTTSIFEETNFTEKSKSVSSSLYNVQKGHDDYVIKFIEPCPKVEWAGELKRDHSFLINKGESDNDDVMENLLVTVFNPNHGQGTFKQLTSDRLESVRLLYRQVGELRWSVARTLVPGVDGTEINKELDFAQDYASKDSYGYYMMPWALAGIPEGAYEIKVETQCERSDGPDDMDMYISPILSGVIDLTLPEQYGQPLPLRDSVMIGEEITIVFSERIRCEKPYTFDLKVIIEETDYELDKENLQVICEDRKISLQIDPTRGIDVETVMGKKFSVELGRIGVESVSHVYDLNDNPLSSNVRFEKTFANLNLDEASTAFTFTAHDLACLAPTSEPTISSVRPAEKEDIYAIADTFVETRDSITSSNSMGHKNFIILKNDESYHRSGLLQFNTSTVKSDSRAFLNIYIDYVAPGVRTVTISKLAPTDWDEYTLTGDNFEKNISEVGSSFDIHESDAYSWLRIEISDLIQPADGLFLLLDVTSDPDPNSKVRIKTRELDHSPYIEVLPITEPPTPSTFMKIKERITDLLGLSMSEVDRVDIKDISCTDEKQVKANVVLLPSSLGTGRFLRTRASQGDVEKENHSVALYQQLLVKSGMLKEEPASVSPMPSTDRKLAEEKEHGVDDSLGAVLFTLSNMKIVPTAADMKAFATKHDLMEDEEELYNFASSSSGTKDEVKHVVMKKTDRSALVEELEISTKHLVEEINSEARMNEENLLKEIHHQQDELNNLQMEFCVVAVACVIIGGLSLLKLKG